MKPAKFLAVFFVAACCVGFAANSTILYKWVDKEGNTKYGDRPPAGVKFERIKVRKNKGGDSAANAITEKLKDDAGKNDPNATVREQLDLAEEQLNKKCKIAKANMNTLNNSRLISISDGEGGTRLISAEEREEKKKQTESQIKEFCGDSGKP